MTPTPGIWTYQHENGDNPRIVSDALDPGNGKPCVIVDLTCSMRSVSDDPYGETTANSLLFAASKDMLSALRLAAERLEMNNYNHEEDEAIAEIQAAIAKAEGKANA